MSLTSSVRPFGKRVQYRCLTAILDKKFLDFSQFRTVSLHHKLNGSRLLSAAIECTNCFMDCLKTKKFQVISEMKIS